MKNARSKREVALALELAELRAAVHELLNTTTTPQQTELRLRKIMYGESVEQ